MAPPAVPLALLDTLVSFYKRHAIVAVFSSCGPAVCRIPFSTNDAPVFVLVMDDPAADGFVKIEL